MNLRLVLGLAAALLLLTACTQTRPLRVAVAANLSVPLQELAAAYEAQTGQPVEVITASSGVLTAQIRQGAPFDLFLSADTKYPQALAAEGLTQGPPVVLVYGQLVLWTASPARPEALTAWLDSLPVAAKVAIANPDLAPYGRAAQEWLARQGLTEAATPRLVFGENIGQVNRYIHAGAVAAAFTAVSAQAAPSLAGTGHWYALPGQLGIPHGSVLLRDAQPGSAALFAFLQGAEAQAVFRRYGYGVGE